MIENMVWIRTAAISDVPAIHAILQASWHAAYDDLIGREAVETITADWFDPMQLVQEMGHQQAEYIVADDGSNLCGVAYALSGADPKNPDTVLIRQLCVHPSHQRRGIGAQLLEELESCFPAARRFQVRILEKNEYALQFFSRHLYEQVKEKELGQSHAQFFERLLEKEIV